MKTLTNYRDMKKTKPKILKFDYNPSKRLIFIRIQQMNGYLKVIIVE